MKRYLLLCLLLLCGAADGRDPAAGLELSIDSLPFFVFEDDRVLLMPQLLRNVPLPEAGRLEHPGYKGAVTLSIGTRQESFSLQVPYYNEQVALAQFILNLNELPHQTETIFTGRLEESKRVVEKRAVILKIGQAMPPLNLVMDHVEDNQGRHVIFAVPRPDREQGRRWYPARIARTAFGPPPAHALIAGMACGDGTYAEALRQALGPEADTRDILLSGNAMPVVELLLKLLAEPAEEFDVVFLVPGSADIRLGTPPVRYGMALHAIVSLFRCRPGAADTIVLATPFSVGEMERARDYVDQTREVAREQAVKLVDLTALFSGGGPDLPGPFPSAKQHQQIGQQLYTATRTTGKEFVVLIVPALFVSVGWIALAWLWLGARMKQKGLHG